MTTATVDEEVVLAGRFHHLLSAISQQRSWMRMAMPNEESVHTTLEWLLAETAAGSARSVECGYATMENLTIAS